ncbi:hypothetical protein L218DRAFT_1008307 [Marasmius fiardii PR-910]|nr:hypothetical protein L218DRAFT_1008307 [Marasmius fiardii PR-910]
MHENAVDGHSSFMEHYTSNLISATTIAAWINALDCVHNFLGLPPGFFKPIPAGNKEMEGITDNYHLPRNETAMSEQETEITGLESSDGDVPALTEQGRSGAGNYVKELLPTVDDGVTEEAEPLEISDARPDTAKQNARKDERNIGVPGADDNV